MVAKCDVCRIREKKKKKKKRNRVARFSTGLTEKTLCHRCSMQRDTLTYTGYVVVRGGLRETFPSVEARSTGIETPWTNRGYLCRLPRTRQAVTSRQSYDGAWWITRKRRPDAGDALQGAFAVSFDKMYSLESQKELASNSYNFTKFSIPTFLNFITVSVSRCS